MKLKEISIEKTKQEKQYEPIKLGITITITDKDNPSESVDLVRKFIDYKLEQDRRKTSYEQVKKELESHEEGFAILTDEQLAKKKEWVKQYQDLENTIAEMEW